MSPYHTVPYRAITEALDSLYFAIPCHTTIYHPVAHIPCRPLSSTTPYCQLYLRAGRARGDVVDGGESRVGPVDFNGRFGVSAACRERHEPSRTSERGGDVNERREGVCVCAEG